jgi:phage tail protein X
MSCLDEIRAVCHPQFAMVRGVVEPVPQGIPGLTDLIASLREAFPDLNATAEEQVPKGTRSLAGRP